MIPSPESTDTLLNRQDTRHFPFPVGNGQKYKRSEGCSPCPGSWVSTTTTTITEVFRVDLIYTVFLHFGDLTGGISQFLGGYFLVEEEGVFSYRCYHY